MKHELYNNKKDIEGWLDNFSITDYRLIKDKEYGYIVNTLKSARIEFKNIKEIKVKFNIINGDFGINNNELTSLYGCPEIVNGSFYCHSNNIYSLEYSPKKIEGIFFVDFNKLKNLKGSPSIIKGDFSCSNNKLKTLEGCPKIINGNFYFSKNNLETLEYCPEIINGTFDCSNNNINSLEYFPKKISKNCYLESNYELGEIQNINNFEVLNKIHESIVLNKNLEKEITIYNNKDKIKI